VNKEVSVAELNKEIDRLEHELLKSKKIIDNLESFIRNKQLELPSNLISDECVSKTIEPLKEIRDEEVVNDSDSEDGDSKDKKVNTKVEEKKEETKVSSKKALPEAIPGIKTGENKDIDLLNELLLKEREMFKLQEKKMTEYRVKYVDMIETNGDLEENIDDLNEELDAKNKEILKFLDDIEKKVFTIY